MQQRRENPALPKALVFAIVYLAYVTNYVNRLNLTMASPQMRADGILSTEQLGLMGSVFSVIYACGRLINGALSDRLSPRKMICGGLVLMAAASITISFLPPFPGLVLLWGVNAYAESMQWSSALHAVSTVYAGPKAKKMTSFLATSVATGNLIGILLSTVLISKGSVKLAFLVPGLLAVAMAVAAWSVLRQITAPLPVSNGKRTSIGGLFRDRGLQLALIPSLLHGVIKDNVSLFMTAFFVDRYAVDLEASAMFVLFVPLLGLLGRLVYTPIYQLCRQREHRVSILCFIVCLLASATLLFGGVGPVLAAVCLSLLYAGTSMVNTSMVSIFPLPYAENGNLALVSGIIDFSVYGGAALGSAVFGLVIGRTGSYAPMFAAWAAVSVLSLVVLFYMERPKKQ